MIPKRNVIWLQRLLFFLTAIHVLNFSVDPPDRHVHITPSGVEREDLSINEMESIGEWILEHIFSINVEERDEPDDDEGTTKSLTKFSIPQRLVFVLLPPVAASFLATVAIPFVSRLYLSQVQEINAPPPQFVLSGCTRAVI